LLGELTDDFFMLEIGVGSLVAILLGFNVVKEGRFALLGSVLVFRGLVLLLLSFFILPILIYLAV